MQCVISGWHTVPYPTMPSPGRRALRVPQPEMVATGPGLYTPSKPEDRKVVPEDPNGRTTFKVVYVVLESRYQSSLTAACKRINAAQVRAPRRACTGRQWWPSAAAATWVGRQQAREPLSTRRACAWAA